MALEKRILEELIYEQVKVSVDLCKLLSFEADLAMSIDRALSKCSASPIQRRLLATRYLRRAWKRVGHDLIDLMDYVPELDGTAIEDEAA